MKIKQVIIGLFVFVIFSQLYLPSFKINISIQLITLLIMLQINDFKISSRLFNLLLPLFLIFGIGFLGFIGKDFKLIHLVKDITHFLKPILGITLGYLFFRRIELKEFIKIIVLSGFLMAIFHVILVLFNGRLMIENVNQLRNIFGKDNFMETFGLLFFCFYNKFFNERMFKNQSHNYIVFFVLVASCIFYFSRTMLVVIILGILTIYGYTKINSRNIKILLGIITVIGLLYIYLFSIKIERNGKGFEAFLYKVKIAPSEIFKTKIDRENHQELWDHWRGYEAKRALALMEKSPSSYIIGTGFGSLINLKFKAPLDDKGIRYISETHNGYIYIFYKTGIIGLILLLYFLFKVYRYIYFSYQFTSVFIGVIGVCFLFTTLTITGIYNPRDVIIIILGGLISIFSKQNILQQKD